MDKTAIKNFAVWARRALIRSVVDKCGLIGIREDGIQNPLPQSTRDMQFFDAGTGAPSSIVGNQIARRDALVMAIREKERDSDYKTAYNYIVEQVAYTWFNRLIAIRFMEVNDYLPSRIRVLSSEQAGKLEPDLVTGPFDANFDYSAQERDQIIQLKDRGQKEDMDVLFRMLFVKQCDALHEILPGLFQRIDSRDYTELLLNISFTDREGVVYHLVNDISEDNFDVSKEGQVEIIGWMYQYYNIEPKDETFALLKKNVKITKERIPAATQLFTPDWIVRYMVENSLGRLWVEGHPSNNLKENWKYYLEEAEQEASVQAQLEQIRAEYRNLNPEDIKVIDPCVGSGHILVYCFDVLMQIYESQGYTQRDAAQSILEHNLYGLDIDERAAQLAYFAVMMKARQYDRRILTRGIKPQVYSIEESNHFRRSQLQFFGAGMAPIEVNKAKLEVNALLDTLRDAKEYGSILKVENCDWSLLRRFAESMEAGDQMSLDTVGVEETRAQLQTILEIGQVMAQRYHVVVTNPPYRGIDDVGNKLQEYVKKYFPDSCSDLSTVFMEQCLHQAAPSGYVAMINIPVWMSLASYKDLRSHLLRQALIINLLHLGRGMFGSDFGTTAFVVFKGCVSKYKGYYKKFFERAGAVEPENVKREKFFGNTKDYITAQTLYEQLPNNILSYSATEAYVNAFTTGTPVNAIATVFEGLKTRDKDRFIRYWFEVGSKRWKPYAKGGTFRRWYGNNDYVVKWGEDGSEIRAFKKSSGANFSHYFEPTITYTAMTMSKFTGRLVENHLFGGGGGGITASKEVKYLLGFVNSSAFDYMISSMKSTVNFEVGQIGRIPVLFPDDEIKTVIESLVSSCLCTSKNEWDAFEYSWDFQKHPLIQRGSIAMAYSAWEAECDDRFNQLKANEEELNRIFIDIYGLQDELTPEVEDKDVTVRKADLGRDIRSLLSYAVGCMFGRYSLDEPGLVYAGGEWDDSKYSTFIPDKDNCIPITDEAYFEDDLVGQFVGWMKKAFGEENLEANLDFIAKALGNKGTTSREVIRNYFLNDFMKDHLKVYQKRPIYWLYDSGKQNGFKALIYMHRYDENTTGRIRADYLFKMQRAYENELKRMQDTIDGSSNSREIALAEKRKEKLTKQLKETRDYDQKLAHLALARIPIDLDDGVKVNYEKVQTAPDGAKLQILAKI